MLCERHHRIYIIFDHHLTILARDSGQSPVSVLFFTNFCVCVSVCFSLIMFGDGSFGRAFKDRKRAL